MYFNNQATAVFNLFQSVVFFFFFFVLRSSLVHKGFLCVLTQPFHFVLNILFIEVVLILLLQ